MNFKELLVKFKSFILECRRVFLVTKKPSKQEFTSIAKVTGIGMLLIGLIGFIIFMLWQVVKGVIL
ncbi:MAG: protein translocase SEC61 complex subunit gamma [Nanoarchaeota archaeon]|nr:protein translocase SEC61 complex subunit gamma [Nanoarchaeota archaeon]MBU0962736.1 protein translocase SEC61 complex subunit gamma [Nanoarchaeota archaeon]